jgi:phosphoribosylamine--glycine ligase
MIASIAPTRVLVLGSGGREHALAWKLAGEPGMNEVLVAPGSDAMTEEARVRRAPEVDPLDPASVVAAARAASVELVAVGPEAPLSVGVADALEGAGIPCLGPTAAAARIETSKAFCHEVAEGAGVRMARARAFGAGAAAAAEAWMRELAAGGRGIVLKADGLAAGKGVVVCDDLGQALDLLPSFLAGDPGGGPRLVIEERLDGREASVIALCDGREAVALPAARDHKRLGDGDRGPNTGGMGAYSPVPDLPGSAVDAVVAGIHRPILAELARRGSPFRGFLYAGLILTADGPVLLECNARLGDPEAQVILPRVAGALGPLCLAAARGDLGGSLGPQPATPDGSNAMSRLPELPGATVGVVLAARGYPGDPERGDPIEGLAGAAAVGGLVFHAATRRGPTGGYVTNGGRVLTVVGRGSDLVAAREVAERATRSIAWAGMQRRTDIAAAVPPAAEAWLEPVPVGKAAHVPVAARSPDPAHPSPGGSA